MPFLILITTALQVQSPGGSPAWTPEAVLITIGFGVITVLLALVSWLGKKMLADILANQKGYLSKQIFCRESLSDRFADKSGTADNFRELYSRTDRHEKILERHRVLLGDKDE